MPTHKGRGPAGSRTSFETSATRASSSRTYPIWVALSCAVVVLAGGCTQQTSDGSAASTGPSGSQEATGSATASGSTAGAPYAAALATAANAILTPPQPPAAPVASPAETSANYFATGADISAPWRQFLICTTTGRADDAPPEVVEPDAVAAAWNFGRAGEAQVDQYAIVYADPAAATAAVERARKQTTDCEDLLDSSDPTGNWRVTVDSVPAGVAGFRVSASQRGKGADKHVRNEYNAVMASGPVVLYMRFNPISPDEGVSAPVDLDPGYQAALLDVAAGNLRQAAGSAATVQPS